MQLKYVEVAVRPVAHGTVAQSYQQPEQKVDRCRSGGAEAKVGAEVK
jgi:hypothetical protein